MEVLLINLVFILSILYLFMLGYFIIRNHFIHKARIKILNEGLHKYNLLLSYEGMLFKKFWVWDINKLYDTEKIKNKKRFYNV